MRGSIAGSRFRNQESPPLQPSGFTLLELLMVVAIIGILWAMLLPTFTRAKQKTRVVQCVSNMKQLGLGIALYMHENADTFPPMQVYETNGAMKGTFLAIGGAEVRPQPLIPSTKIRPLYPYIKPSGVFHCPDDKGYEGLKGYWDFDRNVQTNRMPSAFDQRGCSYMYNVLPPDRTRVPLDPNGLGSGAKLSWVPNPASFIMMYEPAARSFFVTGAQKHEVFWHWHGSTFPNVVARERLASDGQRFISSIVFVDGHAANLDFTETIRSSPEYCCEPAKNWVWYKPAPRP